MSDDSEEMPEELLEFGSNLRNLLLTYRNGVHENKLIADFRDVTGEDVPEILGKFEYKGLDDPELLEDFEELIRFENGIFHGIPLDIQMAQVDLIRKTRNRKLDKFGRRRRRRRKPLFARPQISKFFEQKDGEAEVTLPSRRKCSPPAEKRETSCYIFSMETIYDGSSSNGVKLIQLKKDNKDFINLWVIGGEENLFFSKESLPKVVAKEEDVDFLNCQIERWAANRLLPIVKSPPVIPKPVYRSEINLMKLEKFCDLLLDETFDSSAGTPLIRRGVHN
ncbi:Oidioi.mRNA.OKI2018_I69.XSR.g13808.t1.cds [Oikopleura dioica]|uniref:Oidioi.mRNA.OKI2018_I69.XSR.g13808.t1.cds n=1 Tax=Oikopleura dioica TaxID=34765 RepID=A0ABN7S7Y8_OIKDI|nr:Oidioi.mRNA.OKI2018_I69.XSR.g13808.t1.cds [Oikopleura dioica]